MPYRPPVAHSGLHTLDYHNPARVTANPDGWMDHEHVRGRRARRRGYAQAARIDRAILTLAGGVE